jgi:hypothetical protein
VIRLRTERGGHDAGDSADIVIPAGAGRRLDGYDDAAHPFLARVTRR